MNEIIGSKCKLLAENLHELKKAFKSERDVLNLGFAGMYMLLGLEPNTDKLMMNHSQSSTL